MIYHQALSVGASLLKCTSGSFGGWEETSSSFPALPRLSFYAPSFSCKKSKHLPLGVQVSGGLEPASV